MQKFCISSVYSKGNRDDGMTPEAASAGARRGDRYIGPRSGASDAEVWTRAAHEGYVDIRVERAGKELSLRLS